MRSESRVRRTTVVVAATLLLFTVWTTVGARSVARTVSLHDPTRTGATHRITGTSPSAVDVTDAVIGAVVTGVRLGELRSAPIWLLPELAAAILALFALRRLRDGTAATARRPFLRGGFSRRAPPLESFA